MGKTIHVPTRHTALLTAVNRTTGPVASRGKGYNYTPGSVPWNLNFASRFQGQIGSQVFF